MGLQEGKRDPCLKVLSGTRHPLLESLLNTCEAWIIGTSNFRRLVAEGKTYHHKCLCMCCLCPPDVHQVAVLLSLLLCLPQLSQMSVNQHSNVVFDSIKPLNGHHCDQTESMHSQGVAALRREVLTKTKSEG